MPAQVIAGDIREHDPIEFKDALRAAGITRIDTAARYTNGESEKKLGRSGLTRDFTIDTKILFGAERNGSLTADAIEKSLTNSLAVLGLDKVNVLYCHTADYSTPIAESAKAFDQHYRQGKFNHLGLSNFPTSMIEEWLAEADKHGYVKPSVYEGQYNLLCRGYETTLFPLLRKHNIYFTGFSPLAGGFLLGNFTADGVQGGSRFQRQTPFNTWYDQPLMHEAIKQLRSISQDSGIPMDELSLRWVVHHSILDDNDAIILGSGKVRQIVDNVAQIRKGPLDSEVVKRLDALWDGAKEDGMKIVQHAG